MLPIILRIWILGPQLVVLSGGDLGSLALLDKEFHKGRVRNLKISLYFQFAFLLLACGKDPATCHCNCCLIPYIPIVIDSQSRNSSQNKPFYRLLLFMIFNQSNKKVTNGSPNLLIEKLVSQNGLFLWRTCLGFFFFSRHVDSLGTL